MFDKARVIQKCVQFSPKSDERRSGSDDWWKPVPSPWGGDVVKLSQSDKVSGNPATIDGR